MNRNFRYTKPKNAPKRGKASVMNGPANSRGSNSSDTFFTKPLHSSDHGPPQLDENPFSHLALEIEMDRPTANPFDKGVMPSFDDHAIEEDYRKETAKKFGDEFGRNRVENRQPRSAPKQAIKELKIQPSLALSSDSIADVPTTRIAKDVKASATLAPARESTTVKQIVKQIPHANDELDLDDFPPKLPVSMPSIDLKPQINIRSRNAIIAKEEPKPRINVPSIRKPVAEPVITKPIAQPATIKSQPTLSKPTAPSAATKPAAVLPVNVSQTKPIAQSAPKKPIIDYFGTNSSSNDSKQETDQKEEYFRESQIEANKILFGVEDPSRPLTNSEVAKRKKLILKLVDQKLKKKLTELMNQLGERSKTEQNAPSNVYGDRNDNFADLMVPDLMVPDSIPENANLEHTQNWTTHPSESSEQPWNNSFQQQQVEMTNTQEAPWPVRPPMYHQSNPVWPMNPTNPFPPGVDPMHINRFPGMPPMQPHWNPNLWQSHMRPPPEAHWQPNWNTPFRQMNPTHLMPPNMYPPDGQHLESNMNPFPVSAAPVAHLSEKPAAEIELELKEKEFLERTLKGLGAKRSSQRRDGDSNRRKSPEKLNQRSRPRERRFSRDREKERRFRDERNRNSEDRIRDIGSSSNRSVERIVHSNALSPSLNLSPGDNFRELMYEDDSLDPQLTQPYIPRSRSRDSRSEDLRVRLSQRRNVHRSRSPTDLRSRLSDNRQNREDDLRYQLAERSRRKRSRSTRSRSRGRSSKKMTKLDTESSDDSEWMKFKNIVGMLMNIDRDAELTTAEMVERKEIMQLLLENPDLLELDDKFVYKFGKGRLNLAVKEAESILYPKGIPNERIASLISKKIAALPTEKKATVTKDSVPIEWIKLGNIVDQVLHLTIAERKNLSDKRMLERDELLLKISEEPDSLLKLGTKYGHRNVEWASKYANKILYHNGMRDKRVDQTITKERKKALDRMEEMRKKLRNSSESHKSSRLSAESDARSTSNEWNRLHSVITKLVQSTLEKSAKMSRDDERRRDDLLVQMSRDPDSIRSNRKFADKIDKTVQDDVIKKCEDIIASVKSNDDKSVVTDFERQRTRLINHLNDGIKRSSAYDQILKRLSGIFGKKDQKLTFADENERISLTEALIKDPESFRTNKKAMALIGGDELVADDIVADVKEILSQLDPSKVRGPKKFTVPSEKVIDIPFVVKIVDASDQLDDTTKTVLLRDLRDMIDAIEHPPKPKLLQQRYIDRRVEVVCANLLTFEWLKRVILSDFKDKWIGADLTVERVPVETKIPRDKLKSVEAVFKDTHATLPFDDIVRELRRDNAKLYPERWELQDGRGKNGDYKTKTIGIDIESLAALEQMNRSARLGRSLVYFDISYMGDNVPNFEATCE